MEAGSGRRLAAILFTDIVGSTAVTARSEAVGLALRDRHRELVRSCVQRAHGRFIEAPGDESLSTFESAVDAVQAALAIQRELAGDAELQLRIGIHLGETIFRGEEVFGDGVNIAARVREQAEAGQILVSAEVARAVRNQPDVYTGQRGERRLKGVEHPVSLYIVSDGPVAEVAVAAPQRAIGPWFTTTGVAAVIAVLALAWWLYEPSVPRIRSIAVLPLENLSNDPDQEYFADGMTEALIGDLAKIHSLRVISRTSVMQYKGVRKPLKEIADELDVDAVVEGTVLRSGDRVRITAQLIEARTDHHLWAERYDRELRDVLRLQEEVATAIANEIRIQLTPDERARLSSAKSVDPALHDLYMRGRFFWNTRSPEGLRQAIRYFEQVVAADPAHARAHAGLADTYALLSFYAGVDPWRTEPQARKAALRALELDPALAEAHSSLGFLHGFLDWDFAAAEADFVRAIELDPGYATAHLWYGLMLVGLRRSDEGIARLEHARSLDPLAPAILADLGLAYVLAGRFEAAMTTLRFAIELDPAYELLRAYLARAYLEQGRPRDAIGELEPIVERSDMAMYRALLARAYAQAGENERALAMAEALSHESLYIPAQELGLLYRDLGDDERAFLWLERAFVTPDPLVMAGPAPYDAELLADPRFQALLRSRGL